MSTNHQQAIIDEAHAKEVILIAEQRWNRKSVIDARLFEYHLAIEQVKQKERRLVDAIDLGRPDTDFTR